MIKGAVNRPVLTSVIFIIIILLGLIGLKSLPVEMYPNIEMPMLSVLTSYPGASAEDVETQITKVLENQLSGISNLKHITSISQENLSVVMLEFDYGTDLTEAANDTRDALDFARVLLPEDAEKPHLIKFKSSMMPVLILSARALNPGIDLTKIVENKVIKRLNRVKGVGGVSLWGGGTDMQVRVLVDQTKIDVLGIPFNQIIGALRANNMNIPVGEVYRGKKDLIARIPGKFTSLQEIREIPVGFIKGRRIKLEDIAKVEFEPADRINYVRVNGKPGVMMGLYKKSGANTVEIAKLARKEIQEINRDYPGVDIKVVIDASEFITSSIKNLSLTILFAIILVILVTLIMLNNLRASLIIATVIPVSLIVAFVYLFFSKGSINIISLSALAITIGMVVDNAIVVIENIFHHREIGETDKESAIFGTQEVIQAITASTITTIVIFLPLLLVKGMVGVMFRQLAITVPIVLLTSLLVAVSLAPMLASKFLKIRKRTGWNERFFSALERWYRNVLTASINHRGRIIISAIIVFIIGIGLFKFINTEFFPEGDTGDIRGTIEMPLGTSLDATNQVVKRVEDLIRKEVPEATVVLSRTGRSRMGIGVLIGKTETSSAGTISIHLVKKSKRKRTTQEIAEKIQEEVNKIAGIKFSKFSVSSGMNPFEGEAPVNVELYGDNFQQTDSIAQIIKDKLKGIKGITSVEISRATGRPELWCEIDRGRLAYYGLSVAYVGQILRTAVYGSKTGKMDIKGDERTIFLSLDEPYRKDYRTLQNMLISTPAGKKIPLGNIISLKEHYGPFSIERKENERVVYIKAGIYGRPLGAVVKDVNASLGNMRLPAGVHTSYGGQITEQKESFQTLLLSVIIGIILVFLVMSAQFESFLDPFIIMFSVPFAVVGVSLAFYLTMKPLSLMGMVGIVMLVGIVVNNAIVMIDYINILRKRGRGLKEAVVEGATRRLRPVLMTTLTTIFGLLPLAISKGSGAEMWSPLGISVIGGLSISTFVTLILVPTLYTSFWKRRRR